jgi:hypothetical protein
LQEAQTLYFSNREALKLYLKLTGWPLRILIGVLLPIAIGACHADRLASGTDSDGDGVPDSVDEFPFDRCEAFDRDWDGLGDNYDEDRDGDGYKDFLERIYGFSDSLNESHPDPYSWSTGFALLDIDNDGLLNGDYRETDRDGDGYTAMREWDFDFDGIVNAKDPDADGDGIDNAEDPDADGDGVPDSLLVDGLQFGDDNCLVVTKRMVPKSSNADEDDEICPAMFGGDDLSPFITPGNGSLPYDDCNLYRFSGWYRGELRSLSRYNCPDCTANPMPGQILTGATLSGLDFVTVADVGTINGLFDPEFFSQQVLPLRGLTYAGDFGGIIINPRTRIGPHPRPEDFSPTPNDYQFALMLANTQEAAFLVEYPAAVTRTGFEPDANYSGVVIWNGFWNSFSGPNTETANEASLMFALEQYAGGNSISLVGAGAPVPISPGYPTTMVYADNLSPSSLVSGIKNGRTTIGATPTGPFLFIDQQNNGIYENAIGVSPATGTDARLRIRYENAGRGIVLVALNGDLENPLKQWDVAGSGELTFSYAGEKGDYLIALLLEEIDSAAFPDLLLAAKEQSIFDLDRLFESMGGYLADDYIFLTPPVEMTRTLNYFRSQNGTDYALGSIAGAVFFK